MAINKRVTAVIDGSSTPDFTDRMVFGQQLAVANLIGGGAGQTVSTVVTFAEALPPTFQVIVTNYQACIAWISAKTTFGFTVNLAPLLAATTLPAGTFDVLVVAA